MLGGRNLSDDWLSYRRAKNKTTNLIKKAKRYYFRQSIDENKGNLKRIWSLLKQLGGTSKSLPKITNLNYNHGSSVSETKKENQRKLDFPSTLVHTKKDHIKCSTVMLYLNHLSFMDWVCGHLQQSKFGQHSQTSKEGSESDPECTF